MSYASIIVTLAPAAIVSGSLLGFGAWLIKRHPVPPGQVVGVAAIGLGSLMATLVIFVGTMGYLGSLGS